jgi:hypothetical protein
MATKRKSSDLNMNVEIKRLHEVGSLSKSNVGRQDGLTSLILRRESAPYLKHTQTIGSFSHDIKCHHNMS